MWNLRRGGIKLMSPALAVGFLTSGPPGMSLAIFSFSWLFFWYWAPWAFLYFEDESFVTLFANNFSHSERCILILFTVSFFLLFLQKSWSLIMSHLFVFISISLWDGSKKICDLCQRVFFLFSSKSFIVPGLTLNLWFILSLFLYIMSGSILFACRCPVFLEQLIEDTVFTPLCMF